MRKDASMGVQKERKSTFLTAFEQREKEARSLFAAQSFHRSCLWMSLSSESSASKTIPGYLYWSTDFTYWPPNFNNGLAVLFALLALNVVLTVLLQLKIIPCDSAYDCHTSSILWNCCDRKSRAARMQSFALWQQATIEFTCHDHSIIACSRHINVWCCFSRTSRSWRITQSAQHHRRGCNNIPSFLQRTAAIASALFKG